MSDPFLGEIRMFPFNFAPAGWALCNGQIIPIPQNPALFSLLGTTYGGNGTSNFALPNLQGSVPVDAGQGTGLPLYDLGETGGEISHALNTAEMPAHIHNLMGDTAEASTASPSNAVYAQGRYTGNPPGPAWPYTSSTANDVTMYQGALTAAGGNVPHNNLMPYLTLNFCIALQGIYPQRP
jgi:microcystin-dependent protein